MKKWSHRFKSHHRFSYGHLHTVTAQCKSIDGFVHLVFLVLCCDECMGERNISYKTDDQSALQVNNKTLAYLIEGWQWASSCGKLCNKGIHGLCVISVHTSWRTVSSMLINDISSLLTIGFFFFKYCTLWLPWWFFCRKL